MNTLLWIIQILLALFFIMPGWGKISASKEKHIADRHIKPGASILPIRILGVLEWLGCIGIVLPWLTGIWRVLTPIAACGFCVIMVSGIANHTIRKEYKMLPMLIVVLALGVVVAYFRFKQLC
ncbi:MAG: DoxX family protein [Flavipsychrobacter sp.]